MIQTRQMGLTSRSQRAPLRGLTARLMRGSTGLLIALLGSALASAHAQESVFYDQITLSATAEREVDNDELVAVVYAQAQAERQVEAADQVNRDIRWALERAESTRGISAQTLQYSSFPVYSDNRRIIGWQARQSLRLESRDSERLSELVGELQSRVAVQSISYQVSREARAAADDELIGEALETFNRRARLVADRLGRPGYRIVRLDINTGGGVPTPVAFRSAMADEVAVAAAAAPSFEAGTQTVSVSVFGTVELNAAR